MQVGARPLHENFTLVIIIASAQNIIGKSELGVSIKTYYYYYHMIFLIFSYDFINVII